MKVGALQQPILGTRNGMEGAGSREALGSPSSLPFCLDPSRSSRLEKAQGRIPHWDQGSQRIGLYQRSRKQVLQQEGEEGSKGRVVLFQAPKGGREEQVAAWTQGGSPSGNMGCLRNRGPAAPRT